jgi:hypothetical protein
MENEINIIYLKFNMGIELEDGFRGRAFVMARVSLIVVASPLYSSANNR